MANLTIPDLTALGANVATGDLLEIADISNSNASRKVTQAQLLQGLTITPTTGTFTLANGATFQVSVNGVLLDQNLETTSSPTFASVTTDSVIAGAVSVSGSGAGAISLTEGTAPSLTANAFKIYSPTDVAAGGLAYVLPGAAATGLLLATNAAGVMTITHSAVGTGVATALAVNVGSAGAFVTFNGALGTPSSGTLTNATGLPASGIAAGVLGGNITLGESTGQIILDPTLSADGTWSGIMQAGTAGATLAFGDLVYLAAADSRWELADADAASTSGDVILGMCVLAAAADGDPTNILLYGKIRADAAFPSLTIGAPAYAGTTAGDIQTAQPSGTDDVIRVVGYGLTADVLLFNPAGTYITHT